MSSYKAFDTLLDSVFVVNEQWLLEYANEAAANLCDVSVRRFKPGKSLNDFLEFLSVPLESGQDLSSVIDATPYREVAYTTPTGKEGWLQVTVQRDSARPEPTWILFARDVTLEKTLHDKYRGELDQKESVIEDLKRARAQLEDYSRNLEKMVEARTAELREANRLLAAILDSLGQGILVFDGAGKCLPYYSKVSREILETSPEGQTVWDVLSLSEGETEEFKRWSTAVFGDMLPFEDLAALGPSRYHHSAGRHIALNFHPMHNSAGQLAAVVMVATDKTDEVQAKTEAEKERNFAKMVIKIVTHRQQFRSFASETQMILEKLKTCFAEDSEIEYDETARMLHTIKGGAATFNLMDVAQMAHESEDALGRIKSGLTVELRAELLGGVQRMEDGLHHILETHQVLLGGPVESTARSVDVPVPVLVNWHERLGLQFEADRVRAQIYEEYLQQEVSKSFEHFDGVLQDTASRLGKKVHPLVLQGGNLRIIPEPFTDLFMSLVHAFRNAVDHGLEEPALRHSSGKDEAGTILVRFERHRVDNRSWLRIEIIDDGKGIDPLVIRRKLHEQGQEERASALSDEDVIQAVFDDDFSTASATTLVSGRGVGLPAIRAEARKLGGEARLHSKPGQGAKLKIEIPEDGPISVALPSKRLAS